MADVERSSSFRSDGQINKDERWVGVQTRTFTRWCNSHLSDRLIKIEDLATNLQNGFILCQLLEIISDKPVKHTKNAKLKLQMMENLNSALDFIKREGLKLVNIGAEDIYGNNLKIILGLIWTLILRYQINKGIAEGSPKWLLLEWVKGQVKPYGVVEPKDFKTSWIDGTVMSALADSLEPGTNPKSTWNGDPLHDVDQAMQRSLEVYEIPRLLDAEDMVEAPDELSLMTYIAQFRDWADKQAQKQAYLLGIPNAAFSYIEGDGLHTGYADQPAHFQIHARNFKDQPLTKGGHFFRTTVTGPAGPIPCQVVDNNNGTYSASYTPSEAGQYTVQVQLSPKPDMAEVPEGTTFTDVKNSPAHPNIKATVSAGHSTAEGPGLHSPHSDAPTHFTITARDKHGNQVPEGGAHFDVVVSGPSGTLKPVPHDNHDGTYPVNYTPTEKGPHTIAVTQNGAHIQGSPFHVDVRPSVSGGHSTAEGPGLHSPYTDVPTHFTVTSRDKHGEPVHEGGHKPEVTISGPSGTLHPEVHDNGDGTYTVPYTPTEKGAHTIAVNQGGHPIRDSPFHVNAKPSVSPAHSTAEGPGVTDDANINTKPTHFKIVARDKHGDPVGEGGHKVDVPIQGPKGPVPANVRDNGDGTYDVDYLPADHGAHHIAPTINDQSIHGFPKDVHIKPCVVTSNCTASGPGVEGPAKVDKKAPYVITARNEAGEQVTDGGFNFHVEVAGPHGPVATEPIHDNGDGTYNGAWTPVHSGPHTVSVTSNGAHIKNSPFHLTIVPQPSAGNSFVEGEGLHNGFDNEPAHFKIHLNDKNNAPITDGHPLVEIQGPAPVDPHVKNNGDGTYDVEYNADVPGDYKINVLTTDDGEGEHVKNSPSTAHIIPGADAGATPLGRFALTVHAVDKHGAPKTVGGDRFDVSIRHRAAKGDADEAEIEVAKRDNGDGTYTAEYTLGGLGRFTVSVTLNGRHVKNSPFTHNLK